MNLIVIFSITITSLLSLSTIDSKRSERSFDGYTVLRLLPETKDQLEALHNLQVLTDLAQKYRGKVDFWKEPRSLNSSVDLMIAPEVKNDIMDTLSARSIKGRVMIPNLQTYVSLAIPFPNIDIDPSCLFLPRLNAWKSLGMEGGKDSYQLIMIYASLT